VVTLRVIILCADVTDKCLQKLDGITILGFQLKSLLAYGLDDIIVVVRNHGEKIRDVCRGKSYKVEFVDDWGAPHRTALASLCCVKLSGETLVVLGDTVWNKRAFELAVNCSDEIFFVAFGCIGFIKCSTKGTERLKRFLRSERFNKYLVPPNSYPIYQILIEELNASYIPLSKQVYVADVDSQLQRRFVKQKFKSITKPF